MVQSFDKMPVVMKQRAKEVGQGATKIVQRVGSAIHREVVITTPVDTGTARSNWVGTLNAPFNGVIPPYSPSVKAGLNESANAQAAIAQGLSAIRLFNALRDRSLHFTNNVGYIRKLNNGHSMQAPIMFVQKAIQVGAQAVRGVTLLRK